MLSELYFCSAHDDECLLARRSDSKDSKDDGRAAGAWHAVLSTFLYFDSEDERREVRSLRPPPFCFGQYLAKMKVKKSQKIHDSA